MKIPILVRTLILGAAVLALAISANAQNAPQTSAPHARTTHKQVQHKKTQTVWTDDNIGSVRSAADAYSDREGPQTDLKDASAKQAVPSQAAPAKPAHVGAPPALSNPKTAGDADKMIAWEDRDLAAQQEFVAKLQDELSQAQPQDQQRLQNLIQQRQQVIAEIQKERQALVDQKQQLEKKNAEANNSGSSNSSN